MKCFILLLMLTGCAKHVITAPTPSTNRIADIQDIDFIRQHLGEYQADEFLAPYEQDEIQAVQSDLAALELFQMDDADFSKAVDHLRSDWASLHLLDQDLKRLHII